MSRTLLCPRTAVAVIATAVLASTFALPRVQAGEPVRLAGNPQLRADRVQMLREEFRERQTEVREQLARYHRELRTKRAHGRKAEPAPRDLDQLRSGASRSALPTRIDAAFV